MSRQSDQLELANGRFGLEAIPVSTVKVNQVYSEVSLTGLGAGNLDQAITTVKNQPTTLRVTISNNSGATLTVTVGDTAGGTEYVNESYALNENGEYHYSFTPTGTTVHLRVNNAAGTYDIDYLAEQKPVRYSAIQVVTEGTLTTVTSSAYLLGDLTAMTLKEGWIINGPFTGLTTDASLSLIGYLDPGFDG
tara:strand:- start:3550 stop:4125 length:576 start_codon:yes stop_codon:yes gene_type:complete